jgi:hypothetical protein
MFRVLWQVIGYREPRRLGADEDVPGRTYRRIVDERSHGDVHESADPDD